MKTTNKYNDRKFDIMFSDDYDCDQKGFNESYDYCKAYIDMYNGTSESYFADYKGGTVSIVDTESGEDVYNEAIR